MRIAGTVCLFLVVAALLIVAVSYVKSTRTTPESIFGERPGKCSYGKDLSQFMRVHDGEYPKYWPIKFKIPNGALTMNCGLIYSSIGSEGQVYSLAQFAYDGDWRKLWTEYVGLIDQAGYNQQETVTNRSSDRSSLRTLIRHNDGFDQCGINVYYYEDTNMTFWSIRQVKSNMQ